MNANAHLEGKRVNVQLLLRSGIKLACRRTNLAPRPAWRVPSLPGPKLAHKAIGPAADIAHGSRPPLGTSPLSIAVLTQKDAVQSQNNPYARVGRGVGQSVADLRTLNSWQCPGNA